MVKEEVEVKVDKVSKVLPETRTKRKVIFLTSCDLVCRSYPYINRVFFYKAEEEAETASGGWDRAQKVVRVVEEGLRKTLVSFFPLAGRFSVDDDGRLQIDCCDAGVEFVEASCPLPFSLLSSDGFQYRSLFWHLARRTNYLRSDYIHEPILSVQITKFADGGGVAIGVSMSHTVADAQSFYNFMRSWAETCRGKNMSVVPSHARMALTVKALLPVIENPRLQNGDLTKSKEYENFYNQEGKTPSDLCSPKLAEELLSHALTSQSGNNFTVDELMTELQHLGILTKAVDQNGKAPFHTRAAPIMEKQMEEEEHRRPISELVQKIFSFSSEVLQRLKERANVGKTGTAGMGSYSEAVCKSAEEGIMGADLGLQLSNGVKEGMGKEKAPYGFTTFEAFCAHWWQSLIRASVLEPAQPVFLLIPINCRQRFLDIPKGYFGNALDGGLVKLTAGELCAAQIGDIASKIHEAIKAATEESFMHYIRDAEMKRNAIPHFDRTGLFHVVDSPKYPVYEIDFGFGTPAAVRAEGFRFGAEVQILAGRLGAGSYDLFCALDSATMRRLEDDPVFLATV